MSGDESLVTRVIARVRAILPTDWLGREGRAFREGTQAISDFVEKNRLLPDDLLQDGLDLSRRKLEGLASIEYATSEKNYAEAIKAFADTEDRKIDTELKRRSLETDLRKKEADIDKTEAEARKANAEADLAEVNACPFGKPACVRGQ